MTCNYHAAVRTSVEQGRAVFVVKLPFVDEVDVEAEGPGNLVEEPGVGEEPLSPGAFADGAAVVGGVQEAMEGPSAGAAESPLGR